MTTVAAMICADGLVMGSDTKVVGGDIKYSQNKIEVFHIGESPLIIGGAGSARHCRDAIKWMRMDNVDEKLGRNKSFAHFLDAVVERTMPDFVDDYKLKYGEEPDLEMIIGCIDEDGTPRIVQLYPDGDYDHLDSYCAIGSGGIFGEVLFRKLYKPDITIQEAERIIAYIIWEIQDIDNNSGEDMQLICIGKNKILRNADHIDIEAYKQMPKAIYLAYSELNKEIQSVNIEAIKDAVQNLNKALGIDQRKSNEANKTRHSKRV